MAKVYGPMLPEQIAERSMSSREPMKAISVLCVYSARIGATDHLSRLAETLAHLSHDNEFELAVAGTRHEQTPGNWARIHSVYRPNKVFILDNEQTSLQDLVDGLLGHYERVLVIVQGFAQLRALISLKRRVGKRLAISLILNSFRVGEWKRYVISYLGSLLCRRYVEYTMFLSPASAEHFVGSGMLFRLGRAGILPLGVEDFTVDGPTIPPPDTMVRDCCESGPETLFRLVYLANFHQNKNQCWVISALASLLKERPSVRLLLLGEGTYFEKARSLAERLGLRTQILFPGRIDRKYVPWVLARCHAGIVASQYETFGHAYIEPMLAGLPIVGTRTGIGKDVIRDFITGFGFNLSDAASLRRHVRFLIDHPILAAEMGEQGRRMIVNNLSWPTIGSAHMRLYSHLLFGHVEK